jgi:hypothetical protein
LLLNHVCPRLYLAIAIIPCPAGSEAFDRGSRIGENLILGRERYKGQSRYKDYVNRDHNFKQTPPALGNKPGGFLRAGADSQTLSKGTEP